MRPKMENEKGSKLPPRFMITAVIARLRRALPSAARPENLPYLILGVLAGVSLISRLLLMLG